MKKNETNYTLYRKIKKTRLRESDTVLISGMKDEFGSSSERIKKTSGSGQDRNGGIESTRT